MAKEKKVRERGCGPIEWLPLLLYDFCGVLTLRPG